MRPAGQDQLEIAGIPEAMIEHLLEACAADKGVRETGRIRCRKGSRGTRDTP